MEIIIRKCKLRDYRQIVNAGYPFADCKLSGVTDYLLRKLLKMPLKALLF